MPERPPIGARVRLRDRLSIPVAGIGRVARVIAHHQDGKAFLVEFEVPTRLLVDPIDVELVEGGPPYVAVERNAQPARVGGAE